MLSEMMGMKKRSEYNKPQLDSVILSKCNILMRSNDNFVDPWDDWENLLNDMNGAVGQQDNHGDFGGEDYWGQD